jgi:proteasome assembly chaperone (PAC2) family protein
MAEDEPLRDPWLISVWPGMGSVALAAGGYLVSQLDATLVHELPARDYFDIQQIEVKDGLGGMGRLPRSMFLECRLPNANRDLLVFIGEAQPPANGYAFCHRLLDYAIERGVKRLFTFAAMATQLHPSSDPRVFGVATESAVLAQLREQEVEILKEGQISGLNGVLLAAGAERDIPGVCLMGELPFFAVGVPNPKASMAALKVFSSMANIDIDFTELARQSEAVEQGLLQLLERMRNEARRQQAEGDEESFSVPEAAAGEPEEAGGEPEREPPSLDLASRHRIESMFDEARKDRSKAFHLKEELDRLGVFEQYEDRFLDLFKKAE